MLGQEPPIHRRSTTAVRCPDRAMCQARYMPPFPLPRTSVSTRSGLDMSISNLGAGICCTIYFCGELAVPVWLASMTQKAMAQPFGSEKKGRPTAILARSRLFPNRGQVNPEWREHAIATCPGLRESVPVVDASSCPVGVLVHVMTSSRGPRGNRRRAPAGVVEPTVLIGP